MKRDQIIIDEKFIRDMIDEDYIEGFDIIENKAQSHDTDDANTYKFVVKRLSDGKFFKGTYDFWSQARDIEGFDRFLEEVFPKTKTITVYE